MTENPDIDATLEEMKAKANRVQAEVAVIRGTGTAGNGTVTATVDSAGHLRDLKLTREALRWGDRLPGLILQATAAAEKNAASEVELAMRPLTEDPRVEAGMNAIRETFGQGEPESDAARTMTEAEIQAADDAYFERMNRRGWTT